MSSFSTIPKTQNAWMVVRQGKPEIALEFKTGVPRRSACQSTCCGVQVVPYNPVCVYLSLCSHSFTF
ncbi:hypothetical protein JVT61DRAFT_11087 [Boletus reticuloceps]|uniref:Uncharacterized protein n=1 Tax=Boletus reticuloceps TaxID=495285 RepID=A0A8I3A4U4_9AGAM|nr:hypothetical protein JVT61DRAFT_11087 [Boletus reticuloceps]